MYFKSNIQFIFLSTKKSYFLLLLGAPALERARHSNSSSVPPPYGIHLSAPALWLSQICEGAWRTPALGHLIGEWAVYFKSNVQLVFVYIKSRISFPY